MLSMGVVKSMQIVQVCYGMLDIALDYKTDDFMSRESNKNHKTNKRIDRRLQNIQDMLAEFQQNQNAENKAEAARRLRNQEKTLNMIGEMVTDKVSLEMLALYVLFVKFCERPHEKTAELNKPDYYMETAAMLSDLHWGDEVGSDLEEKCMNMAYKAIEKVGA